MSATEDSSLARDVLPSLDAIHRLDEILSARHTSDEEAAILLGLRRRLIAELGASFEARLTLSEAQLWSALEPTARAALEFWVDFMKMGAGADGRTPLTAGQKSRLLCIVRAISWTETRHGSDTNNRGDVDPMQMGHPADAWWRSLTGQTASDRFVGGQGAGNYWSKDLPAAVKAKVPAAADVTRINTASGHNDAGFTVANSFYFGVPYLLLRINGNPFFNCGDVSRDRLFEGAVRYNANPAEEPAYRARLKANLDQTGCLP
jgi:hypothetical protein